MEKISWMYKNVQKMTWKNKNEMECCFLPIDSAARRNLAFPWKDLRQRPAWSRLVRQNKEPEGWAGSACLASAENEEEVKQQQLYSGQGGYDPVEPPTRELKNFVQNKN